LGSLRKTSCRVGRTDGRGPTLSLNAAITAIPQNDVYHSSDGAVLLVVKAERLSTACAGRRYCCCGTNRSERIQFSELSEFQNGGGG